MRQSAESRFSNEGNLMISSSDEMSYIELKRNVPTDAVTVTLSHGTMRALRHNIHNFGLSEPGVPAGYPMCHFPNMDQNSRILMSDDNGLNGFQEVTFVIGGVGVGSILARGLDPSLKTLQDAGLRFAIIDKISSDNKDRTQLIDSSDRTIVVNNDNIPGEEIIRTIVTSADNLLFKLDKVDPALCKGQKMTILSGR